MRALPILMSLLLAACTVPTTQGDDTAHVDAPPKNAAPQTPQAGKPAKTAPVNGPLPSARARTVQVDGSCETDADCVVKDVGACCGAMPACVNRNSPTDPAGVRAACSVQNRASVCGFNEITACHCVRGHCAAEQEPVGGWTDDPPPPKPEDR
jgi:hypothetical protein